MPGATPLHLHPHQPPSPMATTHPAAPTPIPSDPQPTAPSTDANPISNTCTRHPAHRVRRRRARR
eukprot:7061322-Prymnesium_polylepis.1